MESRLTPLSVETLVQMKPGDRFRVFWAKDDDPYYVRCNYEVQTVHSIDWLPDGLMAFVQTVEGYEWGIDWSRRRNLIENEIDTSRGMAYFYEVD